MNFDNLQLRSEKVRSIAGTIPARYLKCGICVVIFLLFLVGIMMFFVQIPLYQEYQLYMVNDELYCVEESDTLLVNINDRYVATGGYCMFKGYNEENNTYYFFYTPRNPRAVNASLISVLLPNKKMTMHDIIRMKDYSN